MLRSGAVTKDLPYRLESASSPPAPAAVDAGENGEREQMGEVDKLAGDPRLDAHPETAGDAWVAGDDGPWLASPSPKDTALNPATESGDPSMADGAKPRESSTPPATGDIATPWLPAAPTPVLGYPGGPKEGDGR